MSVFVKSHRRGQSIVAAYQRTNHAANRVAKRIATVLGGKGYKSAHVKAQRLNLLKTLNSRSRTAFGEVSKKLRRSKKLLKGRGVRSRAIY